MTLRQSSPDFGRKLVVPRTSQVSQLAKTPEDYCQPRRDFCEKAIPCENLDDCSTANSLVSMNSGTVARTNLDEMHVPIQHSDISLPDFHSSTLPSPESTPTATQSCCENIPIDPADAASVHSQKSQEKIQNIAHSCASASPKDFVDSDIMEAAQICDEAEFLVSRKHFVKRSRIPSKVAPASSVISGKFTFF
jgi:hypothetical protein